jgi:hypothetical protein
VLPEVLPNVLPNLALQCFRFPLSILFSLLGFDVTVVLLIVVVVVTSVVVVIGVVVALPVRGFFLGD